MTTGTYPPTGGSPERGGSFVPVEANEQGAVKIDKRLLDLQREIGVKSCDFVAAVSQIDPFNFVFTEGEMGDMTEKAVLRSLRLIDLSGLPYDELYKERDGILIRQFLNVHSSDQNFKNGVRFMRDWIVSLRPFIEGKADYTSRPDNRLTVRGLYLPFHILDLHLSRDPRGLSLIELLGRNFQLGYVDRSIPTHADGIGFGVDLFTTAGLEYTQQRMMELSTLQHAMRFLEETDALIARFGSVPFDLR